ncbi:protein-serine/threonine kinase [Cryptococcus neoformans Tu401-1]|nr:protein-serine/threonine kinase [Cryptococcus neoformans var. grubii Tu401-1]OXM81444.1 protein-serine/threonine kinase [Cryptococcus neoformans var. grubii Bt63]
MPASEGRYLAALPAEHKDAAPESLYQKLEIVGKGAYGAVYRGKHIATGHIVALKIINLDTEDDDVADIQKEISLLQQLMLGGSNSGGPPPNVIKYYGSLMQGPRVWIIMEYAEGGSIRTLSRAQPLKELHICLVIREVLLALAFLHKNGVIHRDIKAANILLTTQPHRILLCDFGVAALLQSSTSKRSTFVGTPYWMAPEVVTEGRMYDAKADIWSLGITLLEMAYGEPPMSGQPAARAVMLLGDKRMRAPRLEGDHWSKEMRDFVVGCLNEEPADRLSAEELSKSKWIKQQSKTPLTAMNDLIARYQAWKESGGQRQSLAAGVGASVDDDDDDLDGHSADGDWAFDTVRSRASILLDKQQSGDTAPSHLSPPTARPAPAPQSLRRLFHDESSTDPDPFQSFAHQQPPTPQTTEDSNTIKQTGRFPSPEQEDPPPLVDTDSHPPKPRKNELDGQTIRQARLGRDGQSPTPLMITTDYSPSSNTLSATSTATYYPIETPQEPTPIARTDAGVPSPRRLRNKMSLDNLSLTPTSKSQLTAEERSKSNGGMRRPSASDARDGLRGFQFPLMTKSGPGPPATTTISTSTPTSTQLPTAGKLFPPPLNRNHSAAPAYPLADPITTNTTTSPTGTSSPGFGGLAFGPRPPMMRQASVAVMEGRAASQSQSQAQAHALALALAQTQAQQQQQQQQQQGSTSPPTPKNAVALGVPSSIGLGRPGVSATAATTSGSAGGSAGGGGQAMMIRSRSGSKAEDGHPVGLRDLLKLSPAVPDMPDLLPPSPSVANTPHKFFPSPSPLAQTTHAHAEPPLASAIATATSSFPTLASAPMSAAASQRSLVSAGTTPASAPPGLAIQPAALAPVNAALGPPIRPLDLSMLESDDVFDELGRMVDDMQSWLGCVESGLEDLLVAEVDSQNA